MPKISVIVPVYNVEKYIDRCLKSLVNQTFEYIEIIIVNDGSTDSSKKIINKYLAKYPQKIRYFEKTNGGLSSARNFGLKYATGEYIAFLDSDDYVEKDMYKLMYEKAKQDDADMVECNFVWEYYGEDKIKKDKLKEYMNKNELIKRARVVAWNKLIRAEIIRKNNILFPEGLIYEDIEFFYKLIPYLNKISYVEKYCVHYVQRDGSISNSQTEKVSDIFKILDNVIVYYIDLGIYNKYRKELNYMYKRILLGSSMKRILKLKDQKLKRKLLFETLKRVINKANSNELIRVEKDMVSDAQKESLPNVKKSLIFGITKLDIGGAERVLVDIANKLYMKYDITILTIYSGGVLEKELNKNIKVINMYKRENKILPIYLLIFGKHMYNKFLKDRYDVEIAFLEGAITRIFSYKSDKKPKKVAWVHNDIKKVFGDGAKADIKKMLDKKIYKRYDKIIFVSEDNKNSFEQLYGEISDNKVIYNYIDKDRIIKKSNEKNQALMETDNLPVILTIARLVKQKGIDRFIRVHKKLIEDGIIHKVYVIGEGEEREILQKLIHQLNVEKTFILLGKKENPYNYIKCVDYFALLSYYEGYGMVIEEAKIFNKPIIITNTAAKEAVKDYKKSLIVENNENAIYQGLKRILQRKYFASIKEDSIYKYNNEYLLEEIENIIINE